MHISEGVLSAQVLISGGVLAAAGTAVGLKQLDYDRIAREIANSIHNNTRLQIILGHGSGSFGSIRGNHRCCRRAACWTRELRGLEPKWQLDSQSDR